MSDQAPEEAQRAPATDTPYPQSDFLLRILAALAESPGTSLELGLTLQVAGATVTGTLIGGAKYAEEAGSAFAKALADRAGMADAFGELFDELGKVHAESQSAAGVRFIHLKDARIFSPGQPLEPGNGLLWRGRLSEVAGFAIGAFKPET